MRPAYAGAVWRAQLGRLPARWAAAQVPAHVAPADTRTLFTLWGEEARGARGVGVREPPNASALRAAVDAKASAGVADMLLELLDGMHDAVPQEAVGRACTLRLSSGDAAAASRSASGSSPPHTSAGERRTLAPLPRIIADAREELVRYLRSTASAGDARTRAVADTCADVVARVFGTQMDDGAWYSLALHAAILRGSTGTGRRDTMQEQRPDAIFCALRARFPAWEPSRGDWDFVVLTLTRQREAGAAAAAALAMPSSLRRTTANALLSVCVASEPMDSVRALAARLSPLDAVGLSILVDGLCKRWVGGMRDDACSGGGAPTDGGDPFTPLAEEIHAAAAALRHTLTSAPQRDAIAWHALLVYEGVFLGSAHAMATARAALAEDRFAADAWTLSTLLLAHTGTLDSLRTSDEALALLDTVAQAVGVPVGRHAVAIALRALLGRAPRIGQTGGAPPHASDEVDANALYEAQRLYNDACARFALRADAALVQPLIDAHCAAFVPDVDAACALLAHVTPPPRRRLARFWLHRDAARGAPDLGLFHPILLACAKVHDPARAVGLLETMARLRVRVPHAATDTLVQHLCHACVSHSDARGVYRAMHALGAWDADAFERVLLLFCRMDADEPWLAPSNVLAVLHDMRAASLHPSPRVYTVVLDFLGKHPHATPAAVRAAHELIKRDLTLEPDQILINALMNAYGHVQEPAQVLGLWDSLVVLCANTGGQPRFIDPVTVIIVCDTCGRAGLLSAARDAVRVASTMGRATGWCGRVPDENALTGGPAEGDGNGKALSSGHGGGHIPHPHDFRDTSPSHASAARSPLITKGVLDAWIECLARCGHLPEAVDVLFREMGNRAPVALRADAKTTSTIFAFARNAQARVAGELRVRIQQELPWVGTPEG
ncbi:hypothetical protein MSPP1_000482 [Malassezia sp. CBS 17886]|nr:hypothetical protein MSPP1_000482 [Malassezia sp. CBS 17886]